MPNSVLELKISIYEKLNPADLESIMVPAAGTIQQVRQQEKQN